MDLIKACKSHDTEKAMDLIMNNDTNFIADDFGKTALMWACEKDMEEVAYELVSIGTATIDDLRFLKPEWEP